MERLLNVGRASLKSPETVRRKEGMNPPGGSGDEHSPTRKMMIMIMNITSICGMDGWMDGWIQFPLSSSMKLVLFIILPCSDEDTEAKDIK